MIPFQKVFTLMLRSFSKPVLAYLRKQQQGKSMGLMGRFFVGIGRQSQKLDHWLNLKVMQTTQKKRMAELKPEILMQKGVQTVYELIFYSIVFGIPLWELYKAVISSKSKEHKMEQKIETMQTSLEEINQKLMKMLKDQEDRVKIRHQIVANQQGKWQEIKAEREKKRYNTLLGIVDIDTISTETAKPINDEASPSVGQ